ncbi:UNVERIFIED_CONTAM: hypothetical protein FKN15_060940 [Acipenser sinensis]
MAHQLELENLKAKHEIEMAVHIKDKEDHRTRLQETRDELEESNENWKRQLEAKSSQHLLEIKKTTEKLQRAELRLCELEKVQVENKDQAKSIGFLKEQISLSEKKMMDYEALQKAEEQSKQEISTLQERLRVAENRLQAMAANHTPQDANVRVSDCVCVCVTVFCPLLPPQALESKCRSGEKKADMLVKEKQHVEAELEARTRKSHDASGQLVLISQELLRKERSLNELRVLLLESPLHSPGLNRDLGREVHRADWRLKEQKLQEDIKVLREKLILLGREKSVPEQRRFSMMDPAASETELLRLQQRLLSTEEALRSALEHNQQVDKLVEAMRTCPEKKQVTPTHHYRTVSLSLPASAVSNPVTLQYI